MKRSRLNEGFTLVELLVVIGIIALLISVLLPALNRARQQANLLNCQSNLRTIGQMCLIYSDENNGFLPPSWSQLNWFTYADTLTLLNNKTYAPAIVGAGQPTTALAFMPAQDSPVFHDLDVPGSGWFKHATAYTANARVFGLIDNGANGGAFSGAPLWDPWNNLGKINTTSGQQIGYLPRKLGGIRHSAQVMMMWDGPSDLIGDVNYGVVSAMTYGIDDYQPTGGHGLCYPVPAVPAKFAPADYSNPIALGVPILTGSAPSSANAGTVTKSYLLAANSDITSGTANVQFGPNSNEMRFRHMGNTVGNFLFCDGHVEPRTLGTVVAQDICLNPR